MENKQNQLGKNRSSGEEKVERIAEENVRERKSGVDAARGKKSNAQKTKGASAPAQKKAGGGVKKAAMQEEKKAAEKSAAKKRVELALKKEERKAEKQKAKAERAKKRAEARAKRREKRLAAKEERRKKRLEGKENRKERRLAMKEKRADSKHSQSEKKEERKAKRAERLAEKKEAKAKRRSEREARRAMLKAETKEACMKRLEKEKAAKIAAKKERREQRYKLRLQRRDAALKRKQQRLENKERRRSENHAPGFGGWLAAVISLGVVTLALGTVVTVGAVRMNQADSALSTGYCGALYELTGTLSEVDGDLAKARVSSGGRAQSEALTDLLVQARLAENTLEKFPVDSETDVNMTAFLNRAGDAAQAMLEKIRAGEKLSASDYKTLGNMYALNKKILEELSALSEELTDKDMAAFMKDKAGNKVYEHFRNIENFAIEGGFASETDNAPAVTEKKEANVSSAQAEESCRGYFADYDIASCEYAGETVSGEIDGYNFTLTDGDGRMLYAVIAKANGALVGFDYYADCTKKNVDFENALAIAENYVKSLGYDNMTAVWASESGVNATFTFVYEQDGVAYYPDALRVKVCEERGKAVGFTAVSFLNNHKDRAQEKTPACKVSEEKAEKTLNSCLNVLNARRAVIRFGDKEKLCYEFACAHGEDGYFVYVDAATGEEVKINRVVPTAQGRYLR